MNQKDFLQRLESLLQATTPEADQRWLQWAKEWSEMNQNYFKMCEVKPGWERSYFLMAVYNLQTEEAVMDCLYDKFKQVHDRYGAEIAGKLYLLNTCLYGYEFLGAAKYLHEGGDESQLSYLSVERGMFDDDDPDFWKEYAEKA